jgi:SAM-dependent methyltransferase
VGKASSESRGHPGTAYFRDIAATLGAAYLRYDFTRGTAQEADFLEEVLALPAGARILDVGCGPGRHALELAARGYAVTGIDISPRFLEIARTEAANRELQVAFFECDARQMPFADEFDAVISICQGGFGLMGDDDALILKRMAEAAKPGSAVALTAFSAFFDASGMREEASFDVDKGVVFESMLVRDEEGKEHSFDAWTSVFTPRELRLLAIGCGLIPENVWSVSPGDFARRTPDLEHYEFMLVARRPSASASRHAT